MKKKLICLFVAMVLVLAMAVPSFAATTYVVKGTKNYLALRNQPMDLKECEIGQLHNGDLFYVVSDTPNGFLYGYTASGQYGYAKENYLKKAYDPQPSPGLTPYTVRGVTNYLALRSTPSRNPDDEIARLSNGDTFRVIEFRRDGYAYGIAPNGLYGYVVSKYLR